MKIKYQAIIKPIFVFLILVSFLTSCKKFLEIDAPITSTNQENVYKYDYTASAVLTGFYAQMMNEFSSGGITSISLIQELSADNLVFNNQTLTGYLNWWRNAQDANYQDNAGFNNYFSNFYPKIYVLNAAIEGLNTTNSLTPSVKNRLLGEAYFLRSFYYFYLVNLFGDVPIVLTTDYTNNSSIARSEIPKVYEQIEKDIQNAITLLDDNYVDGSIIKTTSERVRPNLSAAQALLARIQLYQKKYSSAETTATNVLKKNNLYSLTTPDSVFKKNSKETIWALQPVKQGYNTDEAAIYLLTGIPGIQAPKYSYLSSSLMSSFENSDKRASTWTSTIVAGGNKYPYAAKYKADVNSSGVTEYCIVLRLAEVYLIRAEARLETNNITGAQEDLNTIRSRAGLPPVQLTTVTDLRNAIIHERRVELFAEWGHRWFDLVRSGTIDEAMTNAMSFKKGTWASYKRVYPIPNKEILVDTKLTQNSGY